MASFVEARKSHYDSAGYTVSETLSTVSFKPLTAAEFVEFSEEINKVNKKKGDDVLFEMAKVLFDWVLVSTEDRTPFEDMRSANDIKNQMSHVEIEKLIFEFQETMGLSGKKNQAEQ